MGYTPVVLQKIGFDKTTGAGSGDVVGPASAVDGHLAVFSGATGKLIKDGGAPAGGSSLSPSYHATLQADAVTMYTGINSVSSSLADTNWNVCRLVLSGNNRDTRTVSTATGAFTSPASLSYTTSLAYSN